MDYKKTISTYKHNSGSGSVYKGHNLLIQSMEKLSTAVYIVTELISDNEPIKLRIRQRALSLLSDAYNSKLNISGKISEMVSFLDIAEVSNIISEMNCSVLKNEFKNLNNTAKEISHSSTVENLFYDENKLLKEDNPKGHNANVNVLYNKTIGHRGLPSVKSSVNSGKFTNLTKFTAGVGNARLRLKNDKKERRKIILDTVKKKKEIIVKDITVLILGCSEKTIQRELMSMVKDKILKKDGKKRWSKYSLFC